jgi:hypothetical protein
MTLKGLVSGIIKGKEPGSDTGKSNVAANIIKGLISVIVIIIIAVLFVLSEREPDVRILNDHIEIKGIYGVDIDFSDIYEISLIEGSMSDTDIGRRTNGYGGIGSTLKGHFRSETLGETLLFIQKGSAPTIKIDRIKNRDVYINFRDSQKTTELFNQLEKIKTSD